MMLRERCTEPEYFDSTARSPEEIAEGYRELARVNELFALEDPYTRVMSRWLGAEGCSELSILDLGSGDAWLGKRLESVARKQGWNWRVTNLDLNPVPLQLNGSTRSVAGSVVQLPFAENSFDVVIASQMTHYLDTEAEVIAHFREAQRVARQAVFITDMTRSKMLYSLLWLMLRVLRISPKMRADGLLSVKRSFTPSEVKGLVEHAGLNAEVRSYYGVRWIFAWRKSPATHAASETTAAYRAVDVFCSAPSGK